MPRGFHPLLGLVKIQTPSHRMSEEWTHLWEFTNTDANSIWKINIHGMILLPKALVYFHPQTLT